jgi:beta-glucosidase
MRSQLGTRLPIFTKIESELLLKSCDFFALNHYTTSLVSNIEQKVSITNTNGNCLTTQKHLNGTLIGIQGHPDWLKIVPWGFYKLLKYVHNRYNQPDIYITENGMVGLIIGFSVKDESSMQISMAVHDTDRVNYYSSYLEEMSNAMLEGVKVKGYMAWCNYYILTYLALLDNYEW